MTDDHSGAPSDGLIGECVGVYRIEGLAAMGSMAKMYSARAPDGQRVAIKLVKQEYAEDAVFRRRFALEAQIARSVSNPHVVAVLDNGEHHGLPYLVQPFVAGRSLEEKLRHERRLDLDETVRICADVAQGLQALGDAGMIHRDVKPGNILLDENDTAYLTDFGLAKDTNADSAITGPGEAMGSLRYMAPEQIRGEPVTPAADLYSLGCVVFECVQGVPPFVYDEGVRILWAHLQDEPPDPVGPPRPPDQFIRVLKSALRKQPEDRPSSCVAYARALSESLRPTG
jgi:serine/threonine protein kinase